MSAFSLAKYLNKSSPVPERSLARNPISDLGSKEVNAAWRAETFAVLVVDDEEANRRLCHIVLEGEGIRCEEAANGLEALEILRQRAFDLVLLDIDMPGMRGTEVLGKLRANPPCANLKIIMLSGRASGDEMSGMMLAGADDYLTKPFSLVQLSARVRAALRLKHAQDRGLSLTHQLLGLNHELEQGLLVRDADLVKARNTLVMALAELVACRDTETGAHLRRLQRYSRLLAEQAAGCAAFSGQMDEAFIALLECCAPLHDIGKVGIPDHILLKPGRLDAEERLIMQSHTVLGAQVLRKAAAESGFSAAFMQMAGDIARYHHERHDGTGYPDRLIGEDIPLAARIVAVGDVYDALRSRRVYKPAVPHARAVHMMIAESPGHFDPVLIKVFADCADRFERLYKEIAD